MIWGTLLIIVIIIMAAAVVVTPEEPYMEEEENVQVQDLRNENESNGHQDERSEEDKSI